MGQPAVVQNDQVTAQCANHKIPDPSSGSPVPAPPLPFAAPLTTGLATTVEIGGKPVAVQGSSGVNTSAHPGLHPSDPYAVPARQEGKVTKGSGTVFAEGKPVAYTGCSVTSCGDVPAQVTGSASTVYIGA